MITALSAPKVQTAMSNAIATRPAFPAIARATSRAAISCCPIFAKVAKGKTCVKAPFAKTYKTIEMPTPQIREMGTFLFGFLISPLILPASYHPS